MRNSNLVVGPFRFFNRAGRFLWPSERRKKIHSNPVSPQFYRSLLQFSLHSFCFFSLSLFLSLPTTVLLSLLHVHASIVRKLDRGKAFETGKKEKENEKGFSRLRIALLRGEIKTPRRSPRVEERRRERIF